MIYTIIVFSVGLYIGLQLEKKGTKFNKNWVKFKKKFRNTVRDNVR